MAPLRDFAQLQLCFVDQSQWRYELIRPLVLCEGGTATQRAEETPTHPQTVRKLMRHFAQQGLLGLLPDNLDVMPPGGSDRSPRRSSRRLPGSKRSTPGYIPAKWRVSCGRR